MKSILGDFLMNLAILSACNIRVVLAATIVDKRHLSSINGLQTAGSKIKYMIGNNL